MRRPDAVIVVVAVNCCCLPHQLLLSLAAFAAFGTSVSSLPPLPRLIVFVRQLENSISQSLARRTESVEEVLAGVAAAAMALSQRLAKQTIKIPPVECKDIHNGVCRQKQP